MDRDEQEAIALAGSGQSEHPGGQHKKQQEKQGHEHLAHPLDAGGHAENEHQTDHGHHHGMPYGVAKAGGGGLEEGGGIGAHQLTGDETGQAVEYPAQDHRITDGDAQRAHQGQPAECAAQLFLSPSGKAVFIGPDGARSGQSADAELGGQAHPAEEKDEEQIGDEEGCAAILSQTVGEHPDVAQAHGGAYAGDDKPEGRAEAAVAVAGM